MDRPTSIRSRWPLFASLALLAALCLPQAASACGDICMEVTPGCERCVWVNGDPNAGCGNYGGPCGCYDVLCWNGVVADPADAALATLGFVPADLQKDQCAASPAGAAVAN
ncbi:MAG TPA: hypothetical protein VEW48_28550 [Thermoanaerobaculia bacterium]|nr:hypothetical protein [Thermoanaerobaculia bacterium]